MELNQRLAAIIGHSRSGTSWLGSIVNSHPDVVYAYEPFTQRNDVNWRLHDLSRELEAGRVPEERLEAFYRFVIEADPRVCKPPFFDKTFPTRLSFGKKTIWPACRAVGPLAPLFRYLYSPTGAPRVVFKEVNKEHFMRAMASSMGVKSTYIVRHPCAVIWSHMKGEEIGMMSNWRESQLKNFLERFDSDLAARFADRAEELDKVERRALLWRVGVEQALRAVEAHPDLIQVVVYEKLCTDLTAETERIFAHLGLDLVEATREFLEACTDPNSPARAKYGNRFRKAYHSVFRDPSVSMNRWRDQMPREDQRKVAEMLRDSISWDVGGDAWSLDEIAGVASQRPS